MFTFGKILFHYLMLLLAWIWMVLQALWDRTGIHGFDMHWTETSCMFILAAQETYTLIIYSLTSIRLEWTDSKHNARRVMDLQLVVRTPQLSVYRSGYWRCTRCRNLNYDTSFIPEDLVCESCVRERHVAHYKASMEAHIHGNGAAEPA